MNQPLHISFELFPFIFQYFPRIPKVYFLHLLLKSENKAERN
jgi:hypothetical protein